MGGINSFFFTHRFPELTDTNVSRCNRSECDMVVGFFDYLVLNGVKIEDITILTFYTGQKKMILKALRNHANFQGQFFKVVTVDSYQGEENKIVLLSLVRSNSYNKIGFLSIENRVCVALSRAQQGFYLFGNSDNLRTNSLWKKVLDIMSQDLRRLGSELPLVCQKHGNQIRINEISKGQYRPEVADWVAFASGGVAAADAEISGRLKAQMIENRGALVDVGDSGPLDAKNPILDPRKLSRPLNAPEIPAPDTPSVWEPVASPASIGKRASPDSGASSTGKIRDMPQTGSHTIAPVVRRAWKEVVSVATLAPVKALSTAANGVPRTYVSEPSLLD
ncbi:hypothetical protein FGG08_005731 [Glutinoglossum americanum]|uniref:DNA2/NAM7 helicase-like C-terminal domain-containing protein n=1 Tax=Glutinoglossum americanum TaxID=1670608 RepID=A0A9P8I4X3_9PEZI|nr:hypothetical protein FGG08_005731 [Glutinoglossum americanum]